MGEFDQNEDTFSFYFDELEHSFIENGQKQHTWGISNAREIWNSFLKFVWCVAAEQNNNNNANSDSSHFFKYILIVRIESLRSEAESSAGKKQIFDVSI